MSPYITPSRFSVTDVPLPEHDRDFEITIEWTGGNSWAVRNPGTLQCLSVDMEWVWEPRPSERDDEWLARHRFPLDRAIQAAEFAHGRMKEER